MYLEKLLNTVAEGVPLLWEHKTVTSRVHARYRYILSEVFECRVKTSKRFTLYLLFSCAWYFYRDSDLSLLFVPAIGLHPNAFLLISQSNLPLFKVQLKPQVSFFTNFFFRLSTQLCHLYHLMTTLLLGASTTYVTGLDSPSHPATSEV